MTRPCSTAATMVAKLSSVMISDADSLATSVPLIPIATPMSALLRAGASLTPSPVMATNWPRCCSASTSRGLCRGETREDRGRRRNPAQALLVQAVELAGVHGGERAPGVVTVEPELPADLGGRRRLVAGDHHRADPRRAAGRDGPL